MKYTGTTTAFLFLLSCAAFAQGGSMGVSGTGSDTGSLPAGWDGALADAFFSDPGAGTLRTEREIRANWANLTVQQRAEVRSYCDARDPAHGGGNQEADATGEGRMATGGSSSVTNEANTPNLASITRLCEWIAD
jgi:predicted Fe-S protein YdhL (DUF1289 family)